MTRSLDYRVYNLKQLAYMIKDNEAKIQACLRKDLDRGEFDTAMTEVSLLLQCQRERKGPQLMGVCRCFLSTARSSWR